MTTLVTGATGFVGAAVTRRLLHAGHAVRVLTRANSDPRNLEGLAVERMVGDLTDRASLTQALTGCEYLFHVAADYRLWAPDPSGLYASNVDGTRNIMQAALAAGVRRAVYTSSVATLCSNTDRTPADERTPVTLADMIGDYKRSKFLAEAEVCKLICEAGLPAVIVNPSTPVGPGDIKPTPTGRMVADAARGRMPAYVDTGLNIVHVDDVADGHLLALERGVIGERYVLGGDNLSLQAILEIIASLSKRRPPRIRMPHGVLLPIAYLAEGWGRLVRARHLPLTVDSVRMARKHMYYSSDKARRELGYAPRPAVEGLRDAVAWFLREPAAHS